MNVMFEYNVDIKKVSGMIKESVLPKKRLTYKSKTNKSEKEVFSEVSKYLKNKYNLTLEMANIEKKASPQYVVVMITNDGGYSVKFAKSYRGGERIISRFFTIRDAHAPQPMAAYNFPIDTSKGDSWKYDIPLELSNKAREEVMKQISTKLGL